MEGKYESVREVLPVVGKKIVDVTCDDWDDIVNEQPDPETRVSKVYVHLDDGSTFAFFVTNERAFTYDGYEED